MLNDYTLQQIGNTDLLYVQPKTAFLCSREVPAEAVLKCYDWAIAMREAGQCIVGGFHSPLEQDVLHYLLKGKQPVIMVLARGLKTNWPSRVEKALTEGRLLILSPFTAQTKRANEHTAAVRNDVMLKLANEVVVGYANPEGMLQRQISIYSSERLHILQLVTIQPVLPN